MIKSNNSYSELPEAFFKEIMPSSAISPELLAFNSQLAKELQLDLEKSTPSELAKLFSGLDLFPNSKPIALAYAGHQFGNFVPQLGDGRAVLLGEVISIEGERFDIQLKGSGQTPFSRRGDGRSSLGPVIREYIVSEAMNALGVPTTRALAAVTTGEMVFREEELPGGIFTRVASSHLRIGTFQYFASRQDITNLKILADYAIERHYPDSTYLSFFEKVCHNQARLIAHWMSIGFIHGVMNTDNMSISGETIDYGPCAFMDIFKADQVYSFIDRQGRYAYNNQIQIAQWNLTRLAECLIPLIDDDSQEAIKKLEAVLATLPTVFENEWLKKMRFKLGLLDEMEEDGPLIVDFLNDLQVRGQDFTNSFRNLSSQLEQKDAFPILMRWRERVRSQSLSTQEIIDHLDATNPANIPRNHLIEKAIQLGLTGDYTLFNRLNEVYQSPFTIQSGCEDLQKPPEVHEIIQNTFCGT